MTYLLVYVHKGKFRRKSIFTVPSASTIENKQRNATSSTSHFNSTVSSSTHPPPSRVQFGNLHIGSIGSEAGARMSFLALPHPQQSVHVSAVSLPSLPVLLAPSLHSQCAICAAFARGDDGGIATRGESPPPGRLIKDLDCRHCPS